MDITESFRNEDITKNDFFDFVITSDLSDNNQQFSKHIRASNAFLSINNDNIIIKQELNNNDEENPISSTVTITSSESLTPTSTTTNLNTYDSSHYWNCDKDTIKLENSIIDDINKYYWQQDEHDSSSGSLSTKQLYENAMAAASATVTPTTTAPIHNGTSGGDGSCGTLNNASTSNQSTNTDGHIYTLTVLNGIDQSSWYRQTVPVSSTMLIKHDDVSLASLVSPSIDHISNSLDIDSILNIIPGHLNGYHQASNESSHHNEHYLNDNNNNRSPNTDDGIVKTETFTYDDSGYADAKDELANTLIIDTPLLEAHDTFSQSSSWKTMSASTSHSSSANDRATTVTTTLAAENNRPDDNSQPNTNSSSHTSSPDSLLRNALQGKAYVRYNGSQKLCQQYHKISMSSHSELRKALSATPSASSSSPSSAEILGVVGGGVVKNHHNQQQQHNLLLQSSSSTTTNKENVLRMYDNHQSQQQQQHHHQQQQQHLTANGMNGIANNRRSSPLLITTNANSVDTSSSNMDDLIFQQLDGVSYPEDFEKLNTIANEVAQSVHTYCLVDNGTSSLTTNDLTLLSTNTIITTNNTGQLQQPPQLTLPVTATATSTTPILGNSSSNNSSSSSSSNSTGNKASLNRKKKLSHSTSIISSATGNVSAVAVTKPLSINNCGTSNGTAIVSLIDSSTGAAATSSSSSSSSSSGSSNGNGRKERSLHYCGICSKGFKDKYSVNVHIRTHTGEKPFSCNLCGKSFRQKAHLAKHYQTHIAQKSASGGSSNSSSPKSVKASSR